MDNYIIKELNIENYELLTDIFTIYQNCFDISIKIPQKEIRKYFLNNIYIINYIIDVTNNNICGFCMHMFIKKINAIQIDYVCINKQYQNKGLAKFLFNHIFTNYCSTSSTNVPDKILTLECEDHLIKFYEKLGCTLIPIKYEVGCICHLNIMFKSAHKMHLIRYYRIVNAIKSENDYNTNYISLCTEQYMNKQKMNFFEMLNKLLIIYKIKLLMCLKFQKKIL